MKLSSAAASRALSAWEDARNEPPDDVEAGAYYDEYLCVRNRKYYMYNDKRTVGPQDDEGFSVSELMGHAHVAWIRGTARGQAFRAAIQESLGLRGDTAVLSSEDCSVSGWRHTGYVYGSVRGELWYYQMLQRVARYHPCKWIVAGPSYEQKTGWVVKRYRFGSIRVTVSSSPDRWEDG